MPPEDDFESFYNQIASGRHTPRPAALTYAQTARPRPMPRQMRGADLRANDPNPGVRRQAQRELSMRETALADPRTAPRAPVNNQFAEAGAMAFEGTGLPAVRRGAANITRGAMNQDPYQGLQQLGGGAVELGLGALGAASIGEFGAVRPRPLPAPRAPVAPPEPMPRMTPPPREIAPNGMPIRPAQPFRNSLRGGNDDLAEAAGFGRAPDVGNAGGGRVVYRGLNRPYDPANGGYYQSFTSSLDDAREYGPNVIAARINPGRNLAVDGGGNNFNALSVEQLPADVRARLHPSIGQSATTDQIAHAAREAGYDSVTVRNVHDNRWGERPARGAEPRTIDFVFDTRNVSPLDQIPAQQTTAAASAEKVKLSAADRALLDELFADDPPARSNAEAASMRAPTDGQALRKYGIAGLGLGGLGALAQNQQPVT